MKKVLIAVDDTKGSKAVVSVFHNLALPREGIVLLYVERLLGRSQMINMLGDAEMSTLKESLKGTEHKERLDEKAEKILTYYKKELGDGKIVPIKTVIREGHPGDEILKVAEDEKVDLILLGSNTKKGLHRLITGCVSRYVERRARAPVIIARIKGCENYSYKEGEEIYAFR